MKNSELVLLDDLPEFGITATNVSLLDWERKGRFPPRLYNARRQPCYDRRALVEYLHDLASARTIEAEKATAVARAALSTSGGAKPVSSRRIAPAHAQDAAP